MNNWEKLEASVKQYAEYIWNRCAIVERIEGVNFDCIIKLSETEWVVIEITQNNSLDKIRSDVAKIQTIRMQKMLHNVMIRPYIVCDFSPTQGMKDAGKEKYIEVISFFDFQKLFFDFPTYKNIRLNKQFGSAVDPITGESDESAYTPVGYELDGNGEINVESLAQKIINGEKIVLLGDYGTGKSRCFREVFKILSDRVEETLVYPIAIDLRETWGLENAFEIIRRHFSHLGIGEKETTSVIKAFNGRSLCFLLDGFDEIGSRPWSENNKTLELLRKHALQGVKDILSKTKSGFLISGRDHYFNGDAEMLSSLGLKKKEVTLAKCKSEFSYEEFSEFLKINKINVELPRWLPRKPLVLKTIASLDLTELHDLFNSTNGNEIEFWFKFINLMCERDSKIHAILDPETVKQVLINLASLTRSKVNDVGPLTETEVVKAFHEVTGTYPNEQSTVMLQRLPGLGRVSAETSDRNFIDHFILDGLRALDLSYKIQANDKSIDNLSWLNPLKSLGSSILAHDMKENKISNIFINHAKKTVHQNKTNKVAACDIISATSKLNIGKVNYEGLVFNEPHFEELSFENNSIENIDFVDGVFEEVILGKIDPVNVKIINCYINKLIGVSSEIGVPPWITNSEIKSFESIDTLTAIKKSGLSKAQTILVSILIKVYRQDGNGRLEHTLTKGLTHVDKRLLGQVIHYLVQNKYLDTSKDKGEMIYKPVRKLQSRVEKILIELDRSNDDLWTHVSQLEYRG